MSPTRVGQDPGATLDRGARQPERDAAAGASPEARPSGLRRAARRATRLPGRIRRRLLDALARRALRRRAQAGSRALSVAAAATAEFPIYAHTFVYQELTAFHDVLGAEVTLFYDDDGPRAHLPPWCRHLDAHKARIAARRDIFERDFDHFRKRDPARVDELLAALTAHSRLDRSALERSDDLLATFTFARRVEALAADYVHTYFFYKESLGGLVAQWLLGLPRGITAYADHMLDDWPLKVVPLHLETADTVVATSSRIADELRGIGGPGCAGRIVVKPNGIDGGRFPLRERRPLGAGGTLELISISRIEPKKGILDLAATVAILRQRGCNVRVHVVGTVQPETPENLAYRSRLDRELDARGVIDAFVFHGYVSQPRLLPLLDRAHAFVAPYLETERGDKDGIPTAILEAMSSGLPVVATDAGSLREAIVDGVEGLVVPQRDAQAMADAVLRLRKDDELRLRLGRNAHARFARQFDVRVTESILHERLRRLLCDRAGGSTT